MKKIVFTLFTFIALTMSTFTVETFAQNCFPPSYTEAYGITSQSATIYIEDADGNTSWNIVISPTALADPSTVAATATVTGYEYITYEATGLSPETTYYYYIQSNCGTSGNSEWIDGVFTTQCADKPIPHSENFDSYTASTSTFPNCWTQRGNSYISNLNLAHQNVLLLNGYAKVALPTFAEELSTLRINLDVQTNSTNCQCIVCIIEDYEDWEMITPIDTITFATANTFYSREIQFGSYTGDGQYIGLFNTGSNRIYIDNVTVSRIPNCLRPEDVETSNVQDHSATITWEEAGSAVQWRGLISTTPITNFSTQTPFVINSQTYNATSLTANTTYYFYVQSVCSGEYSEWASTSFTTLCSSTTLPTTESFTLNQLPSCWNRERIVGTANVTFVSSGSNPTCQPASGSAMAQWSSSTNGNNWQSRLISLPLNTTGTSALDVNFQWHHDQGSPTVLNDGVQIQYSFDGQTWQNSTQGLIRRYDATQSGWQEYDVIIPEAGNHTRVYVGFLFQTGGGGGNCYLDEPTFRASNGCFKPTNVTANNVAGNNATITWTEIGTAQSWNLILSETPVTDFTYATPVHVTSTTYQATGLNPTTTYYVYVQSQCSPNNCSEWTQPMTFTTTCGNILNFPYKESFENYGTCSNAFPTCWVRQGQPELGQYFHEGQTCVTPSATDMDASEGDHSLLICTPSGGFTYTISPVLSEDVRNLAVTFFIQKIGSQYAGTFEVGVMSNPNDFATFESIDTIEVAADGTWEYHHVSLTSATLAGSGNRIAFRHHGIIDANYYLLDEVTFMMSTNCWPAIHLTVDAITGNSATLDWIDPNETTAQWDIKIADHTLPNLDFPANVIDQTIGENHFSINYLQGGTTYYYYVRPNCGNEGTGDWVSGEFTTLPCNCFVDIIMNDSYGNGWEGAKIQLKHGTSVFAEATLEDGSCDTARIYTCEAANIDYYFVSGSYDQDISFSIKNSLGNTIYTSTGTPVAGCFTSGTPACGISCSAVPSNLTATSSPEGTLLTWTGTTNGLSYNIYKNDVILAEYIPNPSYLDENVGGAAACYTVSANCIVGESGLSAQTCVTDIQEADIQNTIHIYPNPARNQFTVQAEFPIQKIVIINAMGQEIFVEEGSVSQTDISTECFSNGLYFVKILNGQRWITKKIIIEK